MSRATPRDPDLVAERIGRLTTDALVTRRGYLRILGILSGGLALGSVAVAGGAFTRPTQGAEEEVVITEDADAIPVGGSVRFGYPSDRQPALLLRLDEETWVAYSAVCTHLACEVLPRLDDDDLYCPCHEGHFDPATGAPTAGPPERPLPQIRLERRGAAIVAVGEGALTPDAHDEEA
ncbi:ubiquinol-cytochrome c reductase iron-sulfur subunit [Euzebya sp.]|uniref:QcrA and Rieske domain-containing protein n=1 Tax=Euzebya sp. TaxID=1971409 RepID=UPI0035146C07